MCVVPADRRAAACCNLRVKRPASRRILSRFMNANLYALLRDHFSEHGEQPCILHPGGAVIHYDELDAMAARMAHALVASGCSKGDRVAVQVDKCWEAVALYLACLRAGLV